LTTNDQRPTTNDQRLTTNDQRLTTTFPPVHVAHQTFDGVEVRSEEAFRVGGRDLLHADELGDFGDRPARQAEETLDMARGSGGVVARVSFQPRDAGDQRGE